MSPRWSRPTRHGCRLGRSTSSWGRGCSYPRLHGLTLAGSSSTLITSVLVVVFALGACVDPRVLHFNTILSACLFVSAWCYPSSTMAEMATQWHNAMVALWISSFPCSTMSLSVGCRPIVTKPVAYESRCFAVLDPEAMQLPGAVDGRRQERGEPGARPPFDIIRDESGDPRDRVRGQRWFRGRRW